jgi:hypothetical protein
MIYISQILSFSLEITGGLIVQFQSARILLLVSKCSEATQIYFLEISIQLVM